MSRREERGRQMREEGKSRDVRVCEGDDGSVRCVQS